MLKPFKRTFKSRTQASNSAGDWEEEKNPEEPEEPPSPPFPLLWCASSIHVSDVWRVLSFIWTGLWPSSWGPATSGDTHCFFRRFCYSPQSSLSQRSNEPWQDQTSSISAELKIASVRLSCHHFWWLRHVNDREFLSFFFYYVQLSFACILISITLTKRFFSTETSRNYSFQSPQTIGLTINQLVSHK